MKWQKIKETEQLYKGSTPCIDDHLFKNEELIPVGDFSKVCSQIIQNTCVWHELVDQTFFGLELNLQRQSQNGQEPVTDA